MKILGFILFFIFFLSCAHPNSPEMKALDRMNEPENKKEARASVISTFKESMESSPNVLVMDIIIDNKSRFEIKDFLVDCIMYSGNKTAIQKINRTVFELAKPGERKILPKVNLGFVNSQTKSFNCELDDFTVSE